MVLNLCNMNFFHLIVLFFNVSSFFTISSAAASNDDSNDVVLVNVLINLPADNTQIMKRERERD